ncbi:RNA-directed DNA polymerase, eukaryota, reverse transcriptase zinc-binding domain protein [Tanacetum coccineum]
MASKQKGGLGISSINALNVGLLFKWLWRFLSQSSDLWISVIKEIHGFHGGIFDSSSYSCCLSPWSGILSVIKSLKKKGIDLISLCSRKLGNGVSTRFWDDVWCGSQPLKVQFPRVYMLDNDKSCCVANRLGLQDWSIVFRRPPRGGIESSQFSELKLLVGSVVLSDHRDSWTWMNLDRKGIDVDSLLYPTCQEDVETVNHIFFKCDLAKQLWALLARWWDLDFPFCQNIMEWHSWLDSSSLSSKASYDATYKYYYHYHEAVELRGDRYYKFSRNQVKEDSTE